MLIYQLDGIKTEDFSQWHVSKPIRKLARTVFNLLHYSVFAAFFESLESLVTMGIFLRREIG